jgi:hypothetical protein
LDYRGQHLLGDVTGCAIDDYSWLFGAEKVGSVGH